jgi:hypothetical protein
LKSFGLDIEKNTLEIELVAKRITSAGKRETHETDLTPCIVKLTFMELIEVSLFDRFPTDGYYIEFSTGQISNRNEVELSINVFDNSSYVYEKPNWIIKAKRVSWKEI